MGTCNHRLFCHYFVGLIFVMLGTVAENVPEKTSANYSVESSTAMITSSFPPKQTTFKDITTTTTIPFIRPDTNATLEFWDEELNTTVHLNAYYSTSKSVSSACKMIVMTPYGKFSVSVADFHKETSNMSNLDSYDYVTRRCDELYPGYVPGNPFNQYFLSFVREGCIQVNSKDYLTNSNTDTIADVIFDYYTKYGLFISPIIMACFALMNIRLFLTKKSIQNEFVLLVFVQSWCYIFWSICYVLSIVITVQGVFGLKLFNPHFKAGEPFKSNPVFLTWNIIKMLSYPFSFMLEMTRFYKTLLKFSALAFPLWHDTNITKRKVSHLVLATLIIAWAFAIIIILQSVPNVPIIGGCNFYYDNDEFLAIFKSLTCFPLYVLYDELFPLGFIVLLLDVIVFFLIAYRFKKSNFSTTHKKKQKLFMYMIIIDMLYFVADLLRRIFIVLKWNLADSNAPNTAFRYNIRMKLIIYNIYELFIEPNRYHLMSIFSAIDMICTHFLLRRIQMLSEASNSTSDGPIDKIMKRISNKFFNKVVRIGNSSTTMVVPANQNRH